MKVVILAGGLGSRLAEETQVRPKPMVEIGGQPILWHIMMIYSCFGLTDFIICLGYKGYYIKEYFSNYILHRSDVTVDLRSGKLEYAHNSNLPPWRISLIDTGNDTQTGGRLRRIKHMLPPEEPFCMTYGDGVANVNIKNLTEFHRSHGLDATVTVVRPPGRFGATVIERDRVIKFMEKPAGDGGYINGGFFVLQPRVLDRIGDDTMPWELAPLEGLAADQQLAAFRHDEFWQPMDTLRDKLHLEQLWDSGRAPWKVWS
jgi:glucose-1-phosphate cytidylyltransferase